MNLFVGYRGQLRRSEIFIAVVRECDELRRSGILAHAVARTFPICGGRFPAELRMPIRCRSYVATYNSQTLPIKISLLRSLLWLTNMLRHARPEFEDEDDDEYENEAAHRSGRKLIDYLARFPGLRMNSLRIDRLL
jgi:hypothetical protein